MRETQVSRKTRETDITASLNLDGGECVVDTGIGFFNHMLELFSVHSGFGLKLKCKGDLNVDCHHTVEDCGIVLGQMFGEAIGNKSGIKRFASKRIPMDESLAECVVDISGRSFLVFNAQLGGKVGEFELELIEEFFQAFVSNAKITLHISLVYGSNNHHKAEAMFKAFARSLRSAVKIVGGGIPSSKGVL